MGDIPIAATAFSEAMLATRTPSGPEAPDPFAVPLRPNMLDKPEETGCFCCCCFCAAVPPFAGGDAGVNCDEADPGVGDSGLGLAGLPPASAC